MSRAMPITNKTDFPPSVWVMVLKPISFGIDQINKVLGRHTSNPEIKSTLNFDVPSQLCYFIMGDVPANINCKENYGSLLVTKPTAHNQATEERLRQVYRKKNMTATSRMKMYLLFEHTKIRSSVPVKP